MSAANNDQSSTRDEARKNLTTTLNRMVKDGHIDISDGHHFQLDENGIPRAVLEHLPTVSPERIFEIRNYTQNYLEPQCHYWGWLSIYLDTHPEPITHSNLLGVIEACHRVTVRDYEWVHLVCNVLEKTPQRLLTLSVKENLAPCIGRFVGTCIDKPQPVGDAAAKLQLEKLIDNHFALYVLISRIHQLYDEVAKSTAKVEVAFEKGKQIVQCLKLLIQATGLRDPQNNIDAEVFVSLKQRIGEISHGEMVMSPEPGEPIDLVNWFAEND
ncbi:hypothetical protein ACHAPA_009971 [Fusarium lateritium]